MQEPRTHSIADQSPVSFPFVSSRHVNVELGCDNSKELFEESATIEFWSSSRADIVGFVGINNHDPRSSKWSHEHLIDRRVEPFSCYVNDVKHGACFRFDCKSFWSIAEDVVRGILVVRNSRYWLW